MTLHRWQKRLREIDPVRRRGRVRGLSPSLIEADGPDVPLGTICELPRSGEGSSPILAEIVRVGQNHVVLAPFEETSGIGCGTPINAQGVTAHIVAGPPLLGRVVDGLGRALDGRQPPLGDAHPLHATPPSPLTRSSPADVFVTGLRAIDGLLTLAKGQRIGIFAASGVGKTSLLTQVATQASADVVIAALIGERGREVETFWHETLSAEARARTTLVAATSDQSAAIRVRAGYLAFAMADYWRGRGRHVLLLVDSVTRLAMAMREIGLSAGEPPTIRGYTPNVFAEIPRLVERAGAVQAGGAITAILTILSETDEVDDPISEMMKSLLDGHIVLSRVLAEQGHLPALDVPRSVSRRSQTLRTDAENKQVQRLVHWLSLIDSSRLVRESGLYNSGSNADLDLALQRQSQIDAFLRQDQAEAASLSETRTRLAMLVGAQA